MINIEPIEAFSDNYIWLVTTNEGSIVIDPGESSKIINYVKDNQLNLKAILITHHHFDHTGGINEILSHFPVDVFGPFNNGIENINKKLKDGDKINIIGIEFKIIEIPGHTLDHIAFYSENNGSPILFCGDTLFAGGCGRVFEGTFDQMYESLNKLKRVLKQKGTITLIEGDHGSAYFHPDSEAANKAIQCQVELQKRNGNDTNIGRKLHPDCSHA